MAPPRYPHDLPHLKPIRRDLRTHGTPAEPVLWTRLKERQLGGRRFRRQHCVGPYVLDFYRAAEGLAVELAGAAHDDPARRDADAERERQLAAEHVRVVRFENRAVFENLEGVLAAIAACFHGAA
jgi:very-short-patch-repair endonuclease